MNKIYKNKFIVALPLTVSLGLSACNFSKVNRVDHEAPKQESAAPNADENAQIKALKTKDINSIYKKTLAIKSEADALAVIKEIETNFLTPAIIDNPAIRNEDAVASAFTYFNEAHIQLIKLAPESDSAKGRMSSYLSFVLQGCNENLDNCSRLKWAKKDPRTQQVLTKIASIKDASIEKSTGENTESQLTELFRIISMAFATASQNKNVELYKIFSKRVHQYVEILGKSKNKDAIKQQGIIFDTIVNNLSEAEDQEIILPIVKAQPPWGFSRKTSQNFNFGSEKIFLIASKYLLYENGALNSELKKMILKEQKDKEQKDSGNAESTYLIAKRLKEDSSTTQIFKNLDFDVQKFLSDDFYDEYFYMIERLRQSHLNYDEVEAIWKGSKKNIATLTQKIRDLARLELVNLVVKTNKYFSVLLETKNLPSDRLFIKSIDESRPLTDTWDDYFSKLSKVANLLGQISTNSQLAKTEASQVESAKDFIMTTKRNAKFMSVYPNMLTLGYFMIKVDAMFKTRTWWGAEISIDPKTIVNYLLDGGFESPWYMFSGDTTALNKSEILLAFDYALRLGSFEIFGQAKDDLGNTKIDRLQFFKALKSTMDTNIKDLTDTIEKMQRVENDSDAALVLAICSRPQFSGVTVNMKLEAFEQYALFGDTTKGLIGSAAKFYEASSQYYSIPAGSSTGRVYSMRDALNNRFLQLRAMSLPLIENIKTLNIPEAEKSALLGKIQAEIKDVYSKLQTYYMTALNNHQLIKNCTQSLVKAERERQFYLLASERQHFTSVYEAMSKVYSEKDSTKKADLAKIMGSQLGIPSDSLMQNNYSFTKYDVYSRLGKYSANPQLKVSVKVEEPDDSSKNSLVADIRNIPFIDVQTGSPVTMDRFLRTAMSHYNSQGMNTVQWFRNNTINKLSQLKQESMIAIYKLGYDLGLQNSVLKFKDRKLQPIKAQEIVQEVVSLARSLHITPEEEALMRIMGQFDLIPFNELQGFLFDTAESDFYGVADNVFQMATRVNEDLGEAERYYKERINTKQTDSMIFPMSPSVEKSIHEIYHRLVKKDETLVADFIKGLRGVQQEVMQNPLRITYRLLDEDNGKMIYASEKIKGAGSVLVDERKIKSLNDTIYDFHNRITYRVYSDEVSGTPNSSEKVGE